MAALLVVVSGCGGSAGDQAASQVKVVQPADGKMGKGDNVQVKNANTVSDPSKTTPGGSYKIEPANPNDPRWKPDPKLGGGG